MTIDCTKMAELILQREKSLNLFDHSEPKKVLVEWRGDTYAGLIQEIAPEFSKEIVALSKTYVQGFVPDEYIKEIISEIERKDPGRLKLIAENYLDLEGENHILRMVGERLVMMTPEQTVYVMKIADSIGLDEIELGRDRKDGQG